MPQDLQSVKKTLKNENYNRLNSGSGHVRPQQGTEICTGFFEFSPVDFFLLLRVYCVG